MHTELGASNFKVRISFSRIGSGVKPGENDNYFYYLWSTMLMLMQSANKLFRILQKSIKSCRIKFNQTEERCRGNFWKNYIKKEDLYDWDYYSFQVDCVGLGPFYKSRTAVFEPEEKGRLLIIFSFFKSIS